MRIQRRLSDGQLLRGARCGDGDAFEVFYRRYSQLVASYLRRRSASAELAADLMAEVFAAALVMVARNGDMPDDPAAWIFGVARNKLADSQRRGVVEDRARRLLELEPVVLDDENLARIDSLVSTAGVEELLDALPRSQREAVKARVLEEREYVEIAAELRCSDLVARKRVSRGLATLRSLMEEAQ
jgi:RNA polymerase sigma factor (sigma-70 family)